MECCRAGRAPVCAGNRVVATDARAALVADAGAGTADRERRQRREVAEIVVEAVEALGRIVPVRAGRDRCGCRAQDQVIDQQVEGVEVAVVGSGVNHAACNRRRGLDRGAHLAAPDRLAGRSVGAVGVEGIHLAVGRADIEHVIRTGRRRADCATCEAAPLRRAGAASGVAGESEGIHPAVVGSDPDAAVSF